jgi:hypothetical protein
VISYITALMLLAMYFTLFMFPFLTIIFLIMVFAYLCDYCVKKVKYFYLFFDYVYHRKEFKKYLQKKINGEV